MLTRLLLCFLLWLPCLDVAWGCDSDENCVKANSWQFGVAVGAGARTNPLVGGDPIPLVVLPDVAWYGEQAYFDNGELGYQWQLRKNLSTELFIAVNSERAYFSFWHPANTLFSTEAITGNIVVTPVEPGSDIQAPPTTQKVISIDEVSQRNWAADTGVRLSWFQPDSEWSFALAGDLLGVHRGYFAQLKYQRNWQWEQWRLVANASLTYKSRQLIDYYYGVGSKDTGNQSLWYSADYALQSSVGLLLNKLIDERWRWVGRLQLSTLGSGMTDSPLVSKRYVANGFIGIGYRF